MTEAIAERPTDADELQAAVDFEPIKRLRKDLRSASETMTTAEARYLVDTYYQMQEQRKRSANQLLATKKSEEPHRVLVWAETQQRALENDVKAALGVWSLSRIDGKWAQSIIGIGPVLSAGLMAHIDITKATTAGKIYRFAGLDPTVRWEKGQKRPWNADLKLLCWKIGDSFVKQSGNPKCLYGQIYRRAKDNRVARNESGGFAELAKTTLGLKTFKDKATRELYEAGKIPPGRVDLQARRVATKLFLSHYQHVAYFAHFNEHPPAPYVFVHKEGHGDYIPPPNWPWPGHENW